MVVTIKDPSKLPKVEGPEEVLRERLKELKLSMRAVSYERSVRLEELKLLEEDYRKAYFEAEAIERRLTPVKKLPTHVPKARNERTIPTDEALRVLKQLPTDELRDLLAALSALATPLDLTIHQDEDEHLPSRFVHHEEEAEEDDD